MIIEVIPNIRPFREQSTSAAIFSNANTFVPLQCPFMSRLLQWIVLPSGLWSASAQRPVREYDSCFNKAV